MEVHNEASLSSGLSSKKAMYHAYMISRVFIPPWSLVMRDRKLLDQTLRAQAAGTLVSPSAESYNHAAANSRKFLSRSTRQMATRTITSPLLQKHVSRFWS